MKTWIAVFAMLLALVSFEAQAAKRLGGGGSIGKQSPNVTQREASITHSPTAKFIMREAR